MYLLDTNVVSELRRPRPHGAVLEWIAGVPVEQLFVSAVTVGEIQAGIEKTREQDRPKAEEIEAWLDKVLASYGVLAMDAPAFREWARLMHRRSDTVSEDAMIAATAIVRRLTVVTATQATSRRSAWNCTTCGRTASPVLSRGVPMPSRRAAPAAAAWASSARY